MNVIRFVIMTVAVFFEAVGVALVVMYFTGPPDPQWTFRLAVGLGVAIATLLVVEIILYWLGSQDKGMGLPTVLLTLFSFAASTVGFSDQPPAPWVLLGYGGMIAVTAPFLFVAGFGLEPEFDRRRR